jgi:hypothetical protein
MNKWQQQLNELPAKPHFPIGNLVEIGTNTGDMYLRDIATFAGTGTRVNPLEHQYLWAYQDPVQAYIHDTVCPEMPIMDFTTLIRYMDEETFYNEPDENMQINKKSPTATIEFNSATQSVSLKGYALGVEISAVEKKDAITQYGSEKKYRAAAMEILKRMILLKRERLVATLFQTAGNFASGYKGTLESGVWSARKKWSHNLATPLKDTEIATQGIYDDLTGASATDCLPLLGVHNAIIFGNNISYYLKNNCGDVKGAVSIQSTGKNKAQPYIVDEALNQYFNKQVIIGRALYNSTPNSASTFTPTYIWADYAIMTTLANSMGGASMTPSFAKTVVYQGKDIPNYKGWMMKSIPIPTMAGGMGGELIVVSYWATEKIFSQKLGWQLIVHS